jgi:serine/threonine-protein kinase RsbW
MLKQSRQQSKDGGMKKTAKRKGRPAKCEMTCRSDPREIPKVEKFLNKVNKKAHLDDGTMYRLLVATTEAVNNAIIHGNQSNPRKRVRVSCQLIGQVLTMSVQDNGRGFDPDSLANPLEEENLLKESGRGIFLIRSLIDEVGFRVQKTGTTVIMKIDLSKLG